jgi:hypothetical protein
MIDWNAFLLVALASVVFGVVITLSFALGVRFFTNAQNVMGKAKKGDQAAVIFEFWNRIGAYFMFAVFGTAIIYGIYLIVPSFHK